MGKASFSINPTQVKENIQKLQAFMATKGLDAFYVSSFDPYLNEYVPMENCHRFYFTNFSGSVAEVLVPSQGLAKLYVDGRYWEQADLEVDASLVEVVKVGANQGLGQNLLNDLKNSSMNRLGFEADRTSLGFYKKLNQLCELEGFYRQELADMIAFRSLPTLAPIKHLHQEYRGRSTAQKMQEIVKDKHEAHFVSAIDSLAWLTNCRGYHLPNLSSFLGKGLLTKDKVYVFIDETTPLDESVRENDACEFIACSAPDWKSILIDIKDKCHLQKIFIDEQMLNVSDYQLIEEVFGHEAVEHREGGLVGYHSIKDPIELAHMQASFARADKAIYNTIRWVKENVKKKASVSELDVYQQTGKMYQEQGACEQSFGTIAGAGPNASIMHYSDPKADVILDEKTMVLLDSGGYFEGGFATDTTRTFMASDKQGDQKQKMIYTLTLKGILNCQNAVFPEGISGKVVDGFARLPLYREGLDFRHGTGHGVGVHVHEGGARISPAADIPMRAGQVVSIEPGIYLPGFGGVRLENVAYVEKHPEFEGFLRFRSLVYIGYDPALIDEALLNSQEKKWLEDYEQECLKRGTSFRY